MRFNKPPTSIEAQIALLRERGLIITDENRARHYLQFNIKKEIKHDPSGAHARQVFIQHYYKKYSDPELPPSWMVFEVLSFGTASQIFNKLKRESQKRIANLFDLDGSVLASWMHSISYLRNLVAHHQRLWNRTFTIKPITARRYASDLKNSSRFYAQAVIIQLLLKTIAPNSQWSIHLAKLLHEHPMITIDRMGFPSEWQERDIWLSPLDI